jgi:hypothetical protein
VHCVFTAFYISIKRRGIKVNKKNKLTNNTIDLKFANMMGYYYQREYCEGGN